MSEQQSVTREGTLNRETHTFEEVQEALNEACIYSVSNLISFRPYYENASAWGYTVLYYINKGQGEYVSHRLYIMKNGERANLEAGYYNMVVDDDSHDESLQEAVRGYLSR